MKTLLTLILLSLLSVNAFANDFRQSQQARQDRHITNESHETNEEMEAIYSNPQGLQNIDERFWNLYNTASDNLGNASNKVNDSTTFTWRHDMARLNENDHKQERPLLRKWIEQRNQLFNIINTAKQGGLDVTNYEQSISGLMNTAKNMENQIASRPY